MKRLGLAVLALAGVVFAGPYDTWNKYRDITVNTTAGGANVTTAQNNFPLLVRLTSASAATGADVLTGSLTTGGADVRFTDSTGATALSFQMERWTGSAAEFWVKVPVIAGNATTKIRMYWGKTAQANASSGPAVFDTANNWRAVYHMNAGPGATTELDATVSGLNLAASDTVAGAIPGDTVGAIGSARVFAGDASTITGRQYFVATGSASNAAINFASTAPHTLSAWVYARTITAVTGGIGNSIMNKGDKMYGLQAYGNNATKPWESSSYTTTYKNTDSRPTNLAAAGAWYLVTGTWSGGAFSTTGTGQIFVNGVLDTTAAIAIGASDGTDKTYNFFVGANPSSGGTNIAAPGTPRGLATMTTNTTRPRYWDGYLDEISISSGVRSNDFVKLTYETQKAGVTAVALGSTQTSPAVAVSNIYYVIPGAGTTPRDTIVIQTGIATNLGLHYDGGPVDSIKLTTGTLPAGLTLDKISGTISGTATAVTAAASQTLTVYASLGNVTRGLRLSVVAGPTTAFTYSKDTVVYVTGISAASNSPSYSGRAPTSYTVTPALPAGITLSATTGVIAGTATGSAAAASAFVVKGMNATDTVSKTLVLSVVALGAETYTTGWTTHKDIWLNTQSNGAAVGGNVQKFPVLVRLDSAFFGAGAIPLASGADIRFTKANDVTRLSQQIESWNSTTKQGAVWVLVDTVLGNNGTQKIRMHWGNASAANVSSGPAVFDTANGYAAVWHMNGASGTNEQDATVNGLSATAMNAPTAGNGIASPARVFNGTNQFFQVPNSASGPLNFHMEDSYTLSAWINPTAISTVTTTGQEGHKLIDKGDNQYVLAVYGSTATAKYWEITTRGNNAYLQCTSNTTVTTANQCTGPGAVITADQGIGSWHQLIGSYQGAASGGAIAESLYFDGTLISTQALTNDNATGRVETFNVNIGAQGAGTAPGTTYSRYWNGLMDEVRISSKLRSMDWVKLEYANQKPTQNLVSLSQPVSINGNAHAMVAGNGLGLNVASMGNGLTFQIQGAGVNDKATLNLVDMWGRTVFTGEFKNGSQLAWNGIANNGQNVSAGIYVARVTVTNTQTKMHKVLEHKVPFTR